MSIQEELVTRLWVRIYYQPPMGPIDIEQAVAEQGRCLLEGFIRLNKTWLHDMPPPTRYEQGSDQYLTEIIYGKYQLTGFGNTILLLGWFQLGTSSAPRRIEISPLKSHKPRINWRSDESQRSVWIDRICKRNKRTCLPLLVVGGALSQTQNFSAHRTENRR